MKITVKIHPPKRIIRDKGLDARGRVQLFHTTNVNRRIGKYMPHLTGFLETKAKRVANPTTIEVVAPYAKYQFYGRVMIDPKTGAAGFHTPDGWKSRRGCTKVLTSRPLHYTRTFNAKAGPHWDRRLVAAEGKQIAAETTAFLRRI